MQMSTRENIVTHMEFGQSTCVNTLAPGQSAKALLEV